MRKNLNRQITASTIGGTIGGRAALAVLGSAIAAAILVSGCGPKAFTKGDYDDPTKVVLLDDKFNEADMQQMAETIVEAMTACKSITESKKRPVVMVNDVQNRTEEHIDMVSLTDKIRTALIKSQKVKFINNAKRDALDNEYKYNEAGNVSGDTKKSRGKQTGADYMMDGEMATNIQQVGDDKLIYYKLTMNLTEVETSEIDCTEEREIRKKFQRRSVGL
jgi:penicillin-binding protein activator